MTQCLPPDVCFLCLSRDRKIFCLSETFNHLFEFLTDCYPQTDARVCWECRATLEKLFRFKEQAERAVCALERARTGLQPMSFECLSKMYSTQILLIDSLVYDDANVIATNDCSVDMSKNEMFKLKDEFEDTNLKIKREAEEESDICENTIYEIIPEHIVEDDYDIGTKCFETVGETEDNSDHAIEYGTKQIEFSETKLRIDAPSTSTAEITSKNVENSSVIKKAQGVVKTKSKREKPIVRQIKGKLTTAQKLNNKERREEKRKYELYQQGKDYECGHCGKKSATRQKLLIHIRNHFKKLMCGQCAYKCRNQSGLKKHMLSHLDPSHRPYECDVCHKKFIDRNKMLTHSKKHTEECKDGVLRRHRRRNYNVKKDSVNSTYECIVCKKIFAHVKEFYKHYYSTHKEEIPCTECNRTFQWKWQLTQHVSTVHRGQRPYQCNICGVTRINKQFLQVHMTTHSNKKPFKCDECLATFKYQCGLYTHKLIHKGDKPHQCDICNARFILKSNLVAHMKVHTKEKPFECDICKKKFPWRRNLKNHQKTHFKHHK